MYIPTLPLQLPTLQHQRVRAAKVVAIHRAIVDIRLHRHRHHTHCHRCHQLFIIRHAPLRHPPLLPATPPPFHPTLLSHLHLMSPFFHMAFHAGFSIGRRTDDHRVRTQLSYGTANQPLHCHLIPTHLSPSLHSCSSNPSLSPMQRWLSPLVSSSSSPFQAAHQPSHSHAHHPMQCLHGAVYR